MNALAPMTMDLPTRPFLALALALAPALAATLALSACGPGIDEATRSSGGSSDGLVRLVSVADDKPSLDLYASTTVVQAGVAVNTVGAYGSVASGSVSLNVRAPGNPAPIGTVTTTLAKGDHRAVVASTTGATFAVTLLSEDEANPDRGKAKLRVVNLASTEAGPLDLFLAASCTGLPSTATATLPNVSGPSSYVQVASSSTTTHLCLTKAGDRTDVRLDVASLMLSDQRIVTLLLVRAAATNSNLVKGLVLDYQGVLTPLTP